MGLTITHPKPKKKSVTKSTDEAMVLLWKTKRQLIIWGRQIARRLTQHGGTVTTRDVRRVMIEEGLCQDGPDDHWHWLGAVFRGKQWQWTGEYDFPRGPTSLGNAHTLHPVMVWRRAK